MSNLSNSEPSSLNRCTRSCSSGSICERYWAIMLSRRGDGGTLGADGFLGDLDELRFAAFQLVGDVGHAAPGAPASSPAVPTSVLLTVLVVVVARLGRIVLVLIFHQVRRVQERALLGPYVDEGGLDAGEHRLHTAQVNVADGAPGIR